MNARTLAFAVSCVAIVGLAGCSSQSAPPPPPAPAPVAAPAPPPPPAPSIPPNLTPRQQQVAKVQAALVSNGATITVDGKWGPATSAALKSYQQAHSLKPTGRMDGATAKALGL